MRQLLIYLRFFYIILEGICINDTPKKYTHGSRFGVFWCDYVALDIADAFIKPWRASLKWLYEQINMPKQISNVWNISDLLSQIFLDTSLRHLH